MNFKTCCRIKFHIRDMTGMLNNSGMAVLCLYGYVSLEEHEAPLASSLSLTLTHTQVKRGHHTHPRSKE